MPAMRAGMEIGDKLHGNVTVLRRRGRRLAREAAALVLAPDVTACRSATWWCPGRTCVHGRSRPAAHADGRACRPPQGRHQAMLKEPIEVLAAFGGFDDGGDGGRDAGGREQAPPAHHRRHAGLRGADAGRQDRAAGDRLLRLLPQPRPLAGLDQALEPVPRVARCSNWAWKAPTAPARRWPGRWSRALGSAADRGGRRRRARPVAAGADLERQHDRCFLSFTARRQADQGPFAASSAWAGGMLFSPSAADATRRPAARRLRE